MKRIYLLMMIIGIPFIALNGQNKSTEDIDKDATLKIIKNSIPKNWDFYNEGGKFILERKDTTWIVYENKINAPFSMETKQERNARIKKNGVIGKSRIVFRYEPKWDANKLLKANTHNDEIYKKMLQLPEKHNIKNLASGTGSKGDIIYAGKTQEEKDRVAKYNAEMEELWKEVIVVPNYHSEKYSLFLITKEGWNDEFHSVYPQEASNEVLSVEMYFYELCGKSQ
jgi:hypothetical protein